MARIRVTQRIESPIGEVWEALADLASHADWMRDAESIVFLTERRSGVGTRMQVKTVVGPFRTLDIMEVTGWDDGRSIGVRHEGLVTGTGTLGVTEADGAALVYWDEELTFPWWLGGPITAWLARPVLAWIWRGNLRSLADSIG